MTHQKLNRIVAAVVFLVTIAIYFLTVSPTVVFWDVGEFIAAAYMLQVPHPPGSPLFLLLARIAMMIPFAADLAVRAHVVSALLSASGILFLYLVIVRVLVRLRGYPASLTERLTIHGSGAIGAWSLAFGTTYWANAIEAEVYGASMFFLAAVMWLAMRWLEKRNEEGSDKYIILIAYLIGLSLGVHLLALLAIFPILMIIYFAKYEFSPASFAKLGGVALLVFGVVYPGIVKFLPGMMDGEFGGSKNEIISYIPWGILAAVLYGAYTSYKKKQRMLHIALLSFSLVFLGYTTYTGVLIRSNAQPPMNENDPSNLARLTSYLGREQYGEAPVLQRRWSLEPQHQGIYTNYSSDLEYLWRYQLNHMFFRYLLWNYAGSAGDEQDAGVSFKDTWGIPLLISLLGLFYQFKKDWKMGLVFITMFVILGPILALYQNQQEPQPRERDYFYVGAFFVFSLWIAHGIVFLIDLAGEFLNQPKAAQAAAFGSIALFAAVIPANLIRINYHEHDRSGNYVAWDYSYNILQTCARDAILFTNGDNDTFPLWYLQDVEGVRRDVRIVNLSLVNTPWYIKQMKAKPYYAEAQAVPISLSDAQIDRIMPVAWETRSEDLPVPREVFASFGVTDTAALRKGAITYTMKHTAQFGETKAIRVQDILVRDIVRSNQWKRPIYFAVTCSPDSKIGLEDYLWFEGLGWRLEPRKIHDLESGGINPGTVEANLMREPQGFSKTPQHGYRFRNIADPKVYFDENTTRLMINYRSGFIRLALYYSNILNDKEKAAAALDRMEQVVPRSKIPLGWELGSDIANFFYKLGKEDRFNELYAEIEPAARKVIESGQVNMNSYYNPYRVLLELYDVKKEYGKSLDLLKSLSLMYPNDPGLKQRIATVEAELSRTSLPPAPPSDTMKGKK